MRTKQTLFFAEFNDIKPIIEEIEKKFQIKYTENIFEDNPEFIVYESLIKVPNIAIAPTNDWMGCPFFLILNKKDKISIREVPQRKGGKKYAIDNQFNPNCIEIKIGGIFKEGILIHGALDIVTQKADFDSMIEVYNKFSKLIKKNFKRIGNFYVGKKAEDKLDSGWRLVQRERQPEEYDLKK